MRNKTVKFMFGAALVFVTLAAVMRSAEPVRANPMNPFPQQVMQADGSLITVEGRGDEFFGWAEDGAGYVVAFDEASRYWRYAYLSEEGRPLPGPEIVRKQNAMNGSHPRIKKADLARVLNETDTASTVNGIRGPGIVNEVSAAGLGNMNPSLLLLLIEFDDAQIVKGMDFWRNQFFGFGPGALNGYYFENSGGGFHFKSLAINNGTNGIIPSASLPAGVTGMEIYDGVARVKLDGNHPTYNASNTSNIRPYIEKAFDAVKGYIDFSEFASGLYEGYIKNEDLSVYAVVAGWERSNTSNTDPRRIHAHASSARFNGESVILAIYYSSLKLQSYAAQGEIYSGAMNASANVMGVGVAAHELGHSLGLPDLYDTTSMSEGVGPYSIMASGSWGRAPGQSINSQTPTHFDAWSKIFLGFFEPVEITAGEYWKDNVYSIESNNGSDYNILKLTDPADPSQYFLVENRGLTGYDAGFDRFGLNAENQNDGGIMIYHVDESVRDSSGRLTNANRYRRGVDVEEADGSSMMENALFTSSQYFYYNHFFSNTPYGKPNGPDFYGNYGGTSGTFNSFDGSTAPNTNFYGSGDAHTVATGIQIRINGARGPVMEVEAGASPSVTWPKYQEKFPDANFRNEVFKVLNADGLARTGVSDMDAYELGALAAIETLDVSGKNIRNMTGLGYLAGLRRLYCGSNLLTALDVSANTELTVLSCPYNNLTKLDVSKNLKLTSLVCNYNDMKSVNDVTGVKSVSGLAAANAFVFDPQRNATVTPIIKTPSAPGGLTAHSFNAQVTLTWTTPSNIGGGPITGYQISYGPTASYRQNWRNAAGLDAGSTEYAVTGLTNMTEYTFEIRAVNAGGGGASSGTVKARPWDFTELVGVFASEAAARNAASLYRIEFVSFANQVALFRCAGDPYELIERGKRNGWPELSVNEVYGIIDPDAPDGLYGERVRID